MALSTTPLNRTDLPDVIVKQTDTGNVVSADVFNGAKSVYFLQLDNAAETVDDVYFKFYDAKSVDPASSLPVMKIEIGQGSSKTIVIADGLPFSTACSFRCVTEIGDTGTTGPSDSSTATLLVGS
jgi:hypothetical protein